MAAQAANDPSGSRIRDFRDDGRIRDFRDDARIRDFRDEAKNVIPAIPRLGDCRDKLLMESRPCPVTPQVSQSINVAGSGGMRRC